MAARVGEPVERHWSNPNARRLIYAAAPFRTATLKTLTAFNFRWPSILFSLVWTLSRTGYPAAPSACSSRLRQGNYLSSPSFPSRQIRRFLSYPFTSFLFPQRSPHLRPSPALSLRASFISHRSILCHPLLWLMVEKESFIGESRFVSSRFCQRNALFRPIRFLKR